MPWPPTLDELKLDMKISPEDTRDDELLTQCLDASTQFVEHRHHGAYNFTGDLGSELPDPGADLTLGTLRLAGRWHTRRRSPDALVSMGELGSNRVPSFDPDIDRLLRIGRYSPAVIA